MITGKLNDITTGSLVSSLPWIRACVEWMGDHRAWSDGIEEVCEGILVKKVEYQTKTPSPCRFENHDREVDFQVIVEGSEWIEIARPENVGEAIETDTGGDVFFYSGAAGPVARIPMQEGCFAVFFPEDVHRCGAAIAEPARIRKYVFKISRTVYSL
jgi:YhcH/YjgK/YiaL family protein